MFIAAFFTTAKAWKQLKCSSVEEWIKNMWYIYTMEYCCSVAKWFPTLCNPWTVASGFSVLHYLPESIQIHVHWVGDAVYLTISSSVAFFSFCFQSFPASGSFLMSQFFTSGGQSIGASASASVLPMNIQDWFSLGLTRYIFHFHQEAL